MNASSSLSLLLFSLFILVSKGSIAVNAATAERTCRLANQRQIYFNYTLCVDILNGDPEIANGSYHDKAKVLARALRSKAFAAASAIEKIIGGQNPPDAILVFCQDIYAGVKRSVYGAILALDSEPARDSDAVRLMTTARDDSRSCEKSFINAGDVSPIADITREVSQTAQIVVAVLIIVQGLIVR